MTKAEQVFEKLAVKQQETSALKTTLIGTGAGILAGALTHAGGLVADVKQQHGNLHTIKDTVDYIKADALKNTKLSPKTMKVLEKFPKAKSLSNFAKYVKRFNSGLATKTVRGGITFGLATGLAHLMKGE